MEAAQIDEHYQKLLQMFASVELIARAVRKSSDQEYVTMKSNFERLRAQGLIELSGAHDNMFFKSMETGDKVLYAYKSRPFDELEVALFTHRNRQYRWLLAEAFEHFQDFIDSSFAYLGFRNSSAWGTKELAGETAESASAKPFGWFLQQSSLITNISVKLERFRTAFPHFAVSERTNALHTDLRFTITLIEMLRHVIVHNGGTVRDRAKFIEKVFSAAGMQGDTILTRSQCLKTLCRQVRVKLRL